MDGKPCGSHLQRGDGHAHVAQEKRHRMAATRRTGAVLNAQPNGTRHGQESAEERRARRAQLRLLAPIPPRTRIHRRAAPVGRKGQGGGTIRPPHGRDGTHRSNSAAGAADTALGAPQVARGNGGNMDERQGKQPLNLRAHRAAGHLQDHLLPPPSSATFFRPNWACTSGKTPTTRSRRRTTTWQ